VIVPIKVGAWQAFLISAPAALGVSLAAGVGLAVWRLVQGWVYARVAGGG